MKPSYQILTGLNIHNIIAPFKQGIVSPAVFISQLLAVYAYLSEKVT
jgi:hypothetical protein